MEIEGYENYLIYPDGRVINKNTGHQKSMRDNGKNGGLQFTLYKNSKENSFSLRQQLNKYYPPPPGIPINGFPDYDLYEDGRVYSKHYHKFLKPSLGKDPKNQYLYYNIGSKPNRKIKKIHRLLAEHFIPNPDNKPCVDHKNVDTLDNRIDNLRWVTHQENCMNRKLGRHNTSGYQGIILQYKKFVAYYNLDKKQIQQSFDTLEEAIEWRKNMVELHYNRPEIIST